MNKKQNKKNKVSKKTIGLCVVTVILIIIIGFVPVYMPMIYQDEISSGEVMDYMANVLSMVASVILSCLAIYQTTYIRQQDERREIERVKPRLVLKSQYSNYDKQCFSLRNISESIAYDVEIGIKTANNKDNPVGDYNCINYGEENNISFELGRDKLENPLRDKDTFAIHISYSDCEHRKYLMKSEIIYIKDSEKAVVRVLTDELQEE